jgi:hypothetical protein
MLLERVKYDAMIQECEKHLDIPVYINSTPKGIYSFNLHLIEPIWEINNKNPATTYFNTVFAKATSAQYADLAEMYVADQTYAPGTVVEFGGNEEVTASQSSHSTAVAGIVSTNPSYLMNATQTGNHVVAVALVGRVPCQVIGTFKKGDRLVASDITGVATGLDMSKYQPGAIIGKALEAYNSTEVGTVEVAVGRT